MKRMVFLCALCLASGAIWAQNDKEINLQEVTIQAAKVISKPDGMGRFSTSKQLETSTSGYGLLAQLSSA